jgi:hypothetical protein
MNFANLSDIQCKHYNDAVRHAAYRARHEGGCFSVWFDGEAMYVRASEAAGPKNGELICIAQTWDDKQVQLHFTGARSEWVNT